MYKDATAVTRVSSGVASEVIEEEEEFSVEDEGTVVDLARGALRTSVR